jgi:site-specific recombinase XerC
VSPTARTASVPETPVPVVFKDDLRKLLGACDGRRFADRRDAAIFRLFLDSGMRLAEMAGLKVTDLDFDHEVAIVVGKGRRPRSCPFGSKTSQALGRYLRDRRRHRLAASEALWLGKQGPLGFSGIEALARRRCARGGRPRGWCG